MESQIKSYIAEIQRKKNSQLGVFHRLFGSIFSVLVICHKGDESISIVDVLCNSHLKQGGLDRLTPTQKLSIKNKFLDFYSTLDAEFFTQESIIQRVEDSEQKGSQRTVIQESICFFKDENTVFYLYLERSFQNKNHTIRSSDEAYISTILKELYSVFFYLIRKVTLPNMRHYCFCTGTGKGKVIDWSLDPNMIKKKCIEITDVLTGTENIYLINNQAGDTFGIIPYLFGCLVIQVSRKNSLKSQLSKKELVVLKQLIKGLTYKEIAQTLFISPSTVKNHASSIYRKLGVRSKCELANTVLNDESELSLGHT